MERIKGQNNLVFLGKINETQLFHFFVIFSKIKSGDLYPSRSLSFTNMYEPLRSLYALSEFTHLYGSGNCP